MRVVIAEDSGFVREGLARLLEATGAQVVAAVPDAVALQEAVEAHAPDVVVTDIRMPPTHTTEGLDAALALRARAPGLPVLVLSQHVESRTTVALLGAGSRGLGYLLKDRVADVRELTGVLQRLCAGETVVDPEVVTALMRRPLQAPLLERLTARERDVLELMAQGRSNAAIGTALFLSPKTVESHIAHLLDKLDLPPSPDDHRRVLAVLHWLRSSG